MEGMQATIYIDQAFSCQRCKKLAQEPYVSDCCEAIICFSCLHSAFKCPFCDKICKLRASNLLSTIYKSVTIECPYKCGLILNLKVLKSHVQNCPETTIECSYCKQNIQKKMLHEHLGTKHVEECSRILINFHKQSGINSRGNLPSDNQPKIQPFKLGTTGVYNFDPRICQVGKFVCGHALVQNRNVSSSLFQAKTKEVCSVQYGSCDRCMTLDIDRLRLPPCYLLNLEGRICLYIKDKKVVACGCSNGNKTCNENIQCTPCKRLLGMIERGFYKHCLRIESD